METFTSAQGIELCEWNLPTFRENLQYAVKTEDGRVVDGFCFIERRCRSRHRQQAQKAQLLFGQL